MRHSWLDEFIGWMDPERGLRRMRARAAAGILRLAYEAARTDRRTQGWVASDSGPNTEIGSSLSTLRKRSRQMVRDNTYAAQVVNVITSYAVGYGISAKVKVDPRNLKEKIEPAWERWVDECDAARQLDFYGLQNMVARTVVESGECLVRRRDRRPSDGLRIPVQLQVIEPDYLDLNKTGATDTGYIIHGVEFDLTERRIFYWLFSEHPGESTSLLTFKNFESHRVPADSVLHIYQKRRAGQVRGVPWMTPLLMVLRDLDEYLDAKIVAKKLQSCLTGVITSPDTSTAMGAASTESGTGHRLETFRPGQFNRILPGEGIVFPELPGGTPGEGDFIRNAETRIASGVGMPYELLTGDHSGVNYSGHKAGMIGFRKRIDEFRWLCLIPMFCEPARRWFANAAWVAGEIPAADYEVKWAPPPYESADPLKDAQANLVNVRQGAQSWDGMISEQGEDPDEVMYEIAARNKKFDDLKITLDCDPRRVSKTGVEQASEVAAVPQKGE